MVQRKIPSNLCIQINHSKSENRVGKLRPPSPRFQDGKNKGAEMKKKSKKTKSMNSSTIESCLKSPNFLKQVPQPGKPPPDEKQKRSPNYMRSTSSFEARTEKSQVSSQAFVKSPKRYLKNSKVSSVSSHKPVKMLNRKSSLKKVRTLTKAPGFKPARAANKKCLQVVFLEDYNSQRETCSSTLRASKFPDYLKLSHGATESEGTSVMKVCPYTYCSLNGHRHAPLPPLKSFLSAKRSMLKTQKVMRLGCLSPRKTKTSGDLEKEILGERVVDEQAAIEEPKVQEDNMNYYIKIYVANKGDDSKTVSGCNRDGVPNKLSNEEPNSENGFENNIGDFNGTNTENYDRDWEEGHQLSNDGIGYDFENSSMVGGNKPSLHDGENPFNISCFDEIPVDEKEKLFVHFGDDDVEFINDNEDEVSIISVLLGKQAQFSGEPQQDETHKDYKPITNETNETNVFDSDICDVDVLVGSILADTENSATNQSLQEMEEKKQDHANESFIDMPTDLMMTDGESNEVSGDKRISAEMCIHQLHQRCKSKNFVGDQNDTDNNTENSIDSIDQAHSWFNKVIIVDEIILDTDIMEMGYSDKSDSKENFSAQKDKTKKQSKNAYTHGGGRSREDLQNNTINLRIIKRERSKENLETEREFNPCEANYLPVRPDPEAEKVDLRHQDLDDRKNAQEWMIDYALQQTVTRLTPVRKRKVALLVEAFEKVIPPHYEPRPRPSPSSFTSARPIQACS